MRPVVVIGAMGYLCGSASADDPQSYSVVAGFGVETFVGSHMRDVIGSGPVWTVRGVVGHPESVSIEVSYVGSRQPINIGGDTLVGTGALGLFRINVYPDARVDPFFCIGAGWARFSVSGRTDGSLLPAHDDVIEIPFGLGVAYRRGAFIADLRAFYTAVSAPDLLPNPMPEGSEDSYMMHRLGVTADVGWFLSR